jgi:hypothetical protein
MRERTRRHDDAHFPMGGRGKRATPPRGAPTTLAYCFASGHIGFGSRCPNGALPIVRGNDKTVREFIETVARHAYDGTTLLVPGVPEASDQTEGLAKLNAFMDWIEPQARAEGLSTGRRQP